MKKFKFKCDFGGQLSDFTFYIGEPKDENHPIQNQADWLSKQRGGTVPQEVMDALAKLHVLAKKNNVSLEDLCVYALGSAQEDQEKPQSTEEDEKIEEASEVENATKIEKMLETEEEGIEPEGDDKKINN